MAKKKIKTKPRAKRATARKAVAKKINKKFPRKATKKSSMGLAVIALLLNILIVPGLGSLIARKIKVGIWQILLFFIGGTALLVLYLPGNIPTTFTSAIWGLMTVVAWIWGLVTGIQLIQQAQ